MSEEPGAPVVLDVGVEIMNSVAGELARAVAVLHGVDPVAAAALGGGASGGNGRVAGVQRVYERRRKRAQAALRAAYDETGLDREQLLTRALEDDRKLGLLVRAAETAMREADEQRVRFYGRIAASGVRTDDDAKVDEAARVLAAIAGLDSADLKVLLHMERDASPNSWYVSRAPGSDGASDYFLDEALPEVAGLLNVIVARLEGAGLITSRRGGALSGETSYRVTEFAGLCVLELTRGEGVGT